MPTTETPALEIANVPVVAPPSTGAAANASLLGGPLHEAGRRLGLVQGSKTVGLGIAIGGSLWIALTVIATIEGLAPALFVPHLLAFHVRLLLVIPLMFVCETMLDPRVGKFVASAVDAGVVPRSERARLDDILRQLGRMRDSAVADGASLVMAVALLFFFRSALRFGATLETDPAFIPFRHSVSLWVYVAVGMTVFRFLIFRWLLRFALWCWFLWRFSRLELRLVAVHPDRSGGLGLLEIVQIQFTPLVVAFSMLVSATLAEDVAVGSVVFSIVYPAAAVVVIAAVAVVFAPLFFFIPRLIACRVGGLVSYMSFASRYVGAFQHKWIESPGNDDFLGSGDIQSLADLANSVSIVREMRTVPAGTRLLINVAVAAAAPLVPLLLYEYSPQQLLMTIVKKVLAG